MSKSKTKTNNNNNRLTRRARRTQRPALTAMSLPVGTVMRPTRPPFGYRGNDTVCLHLRGTRAFQNRSASNATYAIAVSPETITTAGYTTLSTFVPSLLNWRTMYSKYVVTDLRVRAVQPTALTSFGYVAINYEADSTGASAPPTNLADVSNAVHYALGNPANPAELSVRTLEYYNDWKSTTTSEASQPVDSQCGVIQLMCENAGANLETVCIMEVEFTIWFAGFRVAS